jgi:ABC-type lipoprotein export system ATPase subunit
MRNAYVQGSLWRRWDLHVHSPESFEQDFGGWDDYVAALSKVEGVAVLGVTDYFTIDGYRRLRELRANGQLGNFELLLPNIELRLNTFVPKRSDGSKMKRLNFHVVFSDEVQPEVIEQQFLSALNFQIDGQPQGNPGQRNLTRAAVEEAGRLVKNYQNSFKDDSDFAAGCKVITFDLDQIRELLERNCFAGKYLLFLAAENWDQIDWGGQDYLTRKVLLQKSHGLFCGQRKTIDWCLGRSNLSEERFISEFGSLKPCVHGSDAHSVDTLCRPADEKFCWIKADPTFEGLRQIVYEPSDRVHVGPSPPLSHDQARVIKSIAFTNSSGWFEDGAAVQLNPGLSSIIGQKGSGKSALAELIAFAAGSWDTEEKGSFINRAGEYLRHLEIRLTWADGVQQNAKLSNAPPDGQKVRYLSQKFVERLCSEDHLGEDLVREIESVIFAHTDPSDTLNASSFDELRAIRTDGIRCTRERIREEIQRLIREDCVLRENQAKRREKLARIQTLSDENAGLQKQMPKPASEEERKLLAELQSRRAELAAAQQLSAKDKQQAQKVSDIRARMAAFQAQIKRFALEIGVLLDEAGIPEEDRAAFRPEFPRGSEAPLARRTAALKAQIDAREGDEKIPAEGTIRWLEALIKRLSLQESADKARQDRVKAIQTRVAAIAMELQRIKNEISQIDGPDRLRIEQLKQERLNAYVSYFENLRIEHMTLEELYQPAKRKLGIGAEGGQQEIDFSIRWDSDLENWLSRGGVLFDQRKTLPYGTMQALSQAAKDTLQPAWTSGDPEKIKDAIETFLAPFRDAGLPARSYLRADATPQDVLQWLFDVDHVQLRYGLKHNKTELEKLSPGTKGIVLLILYLGMDISDTRPLVVDQPDENLDNESIYRLLKNYFRTAKARRQIVLISHNPNLVVNADSELLIVATCERRENGLPHISYAAGGLENTSEDGTGIRQKACRILEGGAEAFRSRENRYAISNR